jgi:hypothetical protein
MFDKTKARRFELLRAIARDVEDVCTTLGAAEWVWEIGGPQATGTAKAH